MKKTVSLIILLLFCCSTALIADEDIKGGILDKNVNSNDEDYASYLIYGETTDTLFFTSSRKVPNRRPIALSAEIFLSTRPSSDRKANKPINEGWSKAKQIIAKDSRIAEFTRGSQAVSDDRIIFAAERDLSTESAQGTSYLFDLWQMTKRMDGFTLPEPLTAVNDVDAWDSQPALSTDGKTLYFVSNRAGGKGGLDIWYSVRGASGNWSKPGLVPNINTPGHEVSPHCGSDGKFYFSSNWDFEKGEQGETGKDIYRADYRQQAGMQVPFNPVLLDKAFENDAKTYGINIPTDIHYNSDKDDEFPFISPDRKAIFITSNRDGDYKKRNIFAFSMPKSKIMLQVNVKEQILDERGNLLIPPTLKVGLPLTIVDEKTGVDQNINSGGKYEVDADRTYEIKFTKFVEEECYQNKIEGPGELKIVTKRPFGPDTLYVTEVLISRQKIEIPPIVFHSTDTLPYFITGYWWPNTSNNISEFRNREESGFFDETGFVDSSGYNYDQISYKIDSIFNYRIYDPLIKLLPVFQDFCRDTLYLKVTIHGYTDPRGLSAGNEHPYRNTARYKRVYKDETITVGVDAKGQPVTINSGIDMFKKSWPKDPDNKNGTWIKLPDEGQEGNVLLSKLRSYYTFMTFDRDMRKKSPIYSQLRDNGRVILDAEGFGIDKEGFKERKLRDDPQSRRIEIYLDVLRPESLKYHKRLAGGTLKDDERRVTATETPETEETVKDEAPVEEVPDNARIENENVSRSVLNYNKNVIDMVDMKTNVEPLPPPDEEPVIQVDEEGATKCFAVRYKTYKDLNEANAGREILLKYGLEDARIAPYFDAFGNQSYRLLSGCFYTRREAVDEINGLREVSEALGLTGKPDIIR